MVVTVETVVCTRCKNVIGERAGAVVRLRHGREVTDITAAASVKRICRHCGEENELTPPPLATVVR